MAWRCTENMRFPAEAVCFNAYPQLERKASRIPNGYWVICIAEWNDINLLSRRSFRTKGLASGIRHKNSQAIINRRLSHGRQFLSLLSSFAARTFSNNC